MYKDDGILTVAWFSAGVSSAVATKMSIDQVDRVIYTHIDDHHADTERFVNDCEEWFDKPVERLQSELKTVEAACLQYGKGYINGPSGANCTRTLKKRVRIDWEKKHKSTPLRYVWGFDIGEAERCIRAESAMPEQLHRFPLVSNKVTKKAAHKILKASGIKRPAMYDLGYNNNNCVGCVKGGMGYWNHIRVDFPDVFASRAALERKIGRSCLNGVFLDKLDPKRGRHTPPIVEDCGILCELIAI